MFFVLFASDFNQYSGIDIKFPDQFSWILNAGLDLKH